MHDASLQRHSRTTLIGAIDDLSAVAVENSLLGTCVIGDAVVAVKMIFRQIQQYLATGRYDEATHEDRYQMMRTYYSMLVERQVEDSVGKMKQFATYFTHGVRGGAQLRAAIYHEHESAAILNLVDSFFHSEPVLAH